MFYRRWAALLAAALLLTGFCAAEETAAQSARIRVAGDVMAHQHQLDVAKREDGRYDFSEQFEGVREMLADADYTVANLETVIIPDRAFAGYPAFNTPPSILDALKDCGVDFLTLANNHILDGGFNGMVSTVNEVENAGFDFGGARRTPEEADETKIVKVNSIRLGFLCYTEGTNNNESGIKRARDYGVAYLKRADFAADVRKLRGAGAEIVVCLPHWGTEYKREPDKAVRGMADQMIAAGVDIIIGSHPHMVQPIEYVTAETEAGSRSVPVIWSLGNFLSNMYKQYTYSGIALEFTVERDAAGECAIRDIGYIPVYVWNRDESIRLLCSGEYLDAVPEGMTDAEYADMLSTYTEITKLIGEDCPVIETE